MLPLSPNTQNAAAHYVAICGLSDLTLYDILPHYLTNWRIKKKKKKKKNTLSHKLTNSEEEISQTEE